MTTTESVLERIAEDLSLLRGQITGSGVTDTSTESPSPEEAALQAGLDEMSTLLEELGQEIRAGTDIYTAATARLERLG